jgi:hypothetical protein
VSVKSRGKVESRVGEDDVREFVEKDEDWVYEKDVGWLKGIFASFLPSIPEHKI